MPPLGRSIVALLIPLSVGCSPVDPESEALLMVVGDMAELVPPEVASSQRRHIRPDFGGSLPGEPLPPRVVRASGLAVAPDSLLSQRSDPVLALSLFKPRVLAADSVEVHAEWLVFGARGGFWGHEYRYVFQCSARSCVQLSRTGPSILN